MPAVYIGGKFNIEVNLDSEEYPYDHWVDNELAEQRAEYDRPNLSIWFEIENKLDEISPLSIPVTNLDIYEGEFRFTNEELNFQITFNGKAKATVSKDVKAAIDAGKTSRITGLAINGAEYTVDIAEHGLTVQSKKL